MICPTLGKARTGGFIYIRRNSNDQWALNYLENRRCFYFIFSSRNMFEWGTHVFWFSTFWDQTESVIMRSELKSQTMCFQPKTEGFQFEVHGRRFSKRQFSAELNSWSSMMVNASNLLERHTSFLNNSKGWRNGNMPCIPVSFNLRPTVNELFRQEVVFFPHDSRYASWAHLMRFVAARFQLQIARVRTFAFLKTLLFSIKSTL